jgi:hypothetical protein
MALEQRGVNVLLEEDNPELRGMSAPSWIAETVLPIGLQQLLWLH